MCRGERSECETVSRDLTPGELGGAVSLAVEASRRRIFSRDDR